MEATKQRNGNLFVDGSARAQVSCHVKSLSASLTLLKEGTEARESTSVAGVTPHGPMSHIPRSCTNAFPTLGVAIWDACAAMPRSPIFKRLLLNHIRPHMHDEILEDQEEDVGRPDPLQGDFNSTLVLTMPPSSL